MNKAKIIWFTGMSGAGKTTIAVGLEKFLKENKKKVLLLDGDKVRAAVNRHLGFTREDISANNLSIIEMCRKESPHWDYILAAVISPFRASRRKAKEVFGDGFLEVYVKASLETLVSRDTKGFYKKAMAGEMKNFIGIDEDVPYEPPEDPDILIDTEKQTPEESLKGLIRLMTQGCERFSFLEK